MPKYVGEFGKKWDERVPRSAISWLMGRVHVGTSDAEIEADIRKRIAEGPQAKLYTESLIKQSVAYALECHKRNRGLYRDVVNGGL